MLKGKNISPNRVALLLSAILGFILVIVIYFFSQKIYLSILLTLLICAIMYFVMLYAINQFVYRKVKLIYKFISQTKATKREEFYNQELLPQKTIDELSDDVEVWANEHGKEIERLQSNEAFRREFLMNLAHELKTPIFRHKASSIH